MSLTAHEDASPLGPLTVLDHDGRLCGLTFGDPTALVAELEERVGAPALPRRGPPGDLVARLRAYFAGEGAAFAGVPLALYGTAFEEAVWRALCDIPAGSLASYGDVARRLGRPGASRAVGGACHRNRIAIAVPCHRVVGARGGLVGYAGGLDTKRWLLAHEGARPALTNDRPGAYTARPTLECEHAATSRRGSVRRAPDRAPHSAWCLESR